LVGKGGHMQLDEHPENNAPVKDLFTEIQENQNDKEHSILFRDQM